jgi:hypothetical protein
MKVSQLQKVLTWKSALVLLAFGILFPGCAQMKEYSIDSYQGPMPLRDYRYLEEQF